MKFRIYIIIAILVAGLSCTLDCLTHRQEKLQEKENIPAARRHEDTLRGNGETPDRYVDYNCAFCATSGTNISAQRTGGNNSIPKNPDTWKRCHEPDSQLVSLHSGKIFCESAVNSFLSTIRLHPSGLMSDSHRFIQLCRLTI